VFLAVPGTVFHADTPVLTAVQGHLLAGLSRGE
jgi:hypothetical protein